MEISTIFDTEDVSKFNSFFSNYSGNEGWRIKINGKFVKLDSKKSIWAQKGHAKAALKEHLHHFHHTFMDHLSCRYLTDKYHRDRDKLWKNWLTWAENNGIVEFVELK